MSFCPLGRSTSRSEAPGATKQVVAREPQPAAPTVSGRVGGAVGGSGGRGGAGAQRGAGEGGRGPAGGMARGGRRPQGRARGGCRGTRAGDGAWRPAGGAMPEPAARRVTSRHEGG